MAARDPSNPALTLEQLLAESRWLTSLARALLGDEHEAEDVAQETRLAALAHGPADPDHVGEWRLVVKLTNQWRALRDFTVGNPDDVVRLRVEVGPPASVEVAVVPATAALSWGPLDGVDRHEPLDANGRALVEGLLPDLPLRFWIADGDLFDEALVTPSRGTTTRLALRAQPASLLRVTPGEPLPAGEIEWELASNGGAWQLRTLRIDPSVPSSPAPRGRIRRRGREDVRARARGAVNPSEVSRARVRPSPTPAGSTPAAATR